MATLVSSSTPLENHNGDGELPLLQQRDRLALRRLRDLEVGIEDVRPLRLQVGVVESLDCVRYRSLILQYTSLVSPIH